MNSLFKVIAVAALGFVLIQISGCASSSTLVDIWHDSTWHPASALGKMLVIDVRKDAGKRRIWEDAFAEELIKHGVVAVTSYSLFPNTLPDTNQVLTAVQTNGFDGVVVIHKLPTETQKHYVQGYTSYDQNLSYISYWPRYYGTYYVEIDHPGYVDSQKVAIRTIDVSTTGNNGRVIWSATSRTPDPASVIDVQRDIVDMVATELTDQNIINVRK